MLLSRSLRIAFLGLLGLVFFLFISGSPWDGLTPEGYKAIGAFFLCLILWTTQIVPLAITGLLAIGLIPLLHILPTKQAFSYFGSEAVFFILGAFILAAALLKTGLSTRLALLFLSKGQTNPKTLLWRILLTSSLLSCFMPEHAVAAFLFPIVLEMARALEFVPFGGKYGRSLFIAMAWGCIIGGVITFLGGGRAPLALGILNEMTGQQISFFTWMKTTLPLAAPLIIFSYIMLTRFFGVDVESVSAIQETLENRKKKVGLMSWGERWVLLIMMGSVYAWVAHGHEIGLANVAIAAVAALFVFKVVSWKDVEEYVNWGIILMYGGAICLGQALNSSGAISWLANSLLQYPESIAQTLNLSPSLVLVSILSFISLFFTELVSNSAVVAILMPVSIGLAQSFNMDPAQMTYVIAVPAGLAFILPIATPALALAYSSGYLKVKEMILPGLIMNITALILFILLVKFWWPLIGFNL